MKPLPTATEDNRCQPPKTSRNPWPIVLVAYFAVFITFIVVFIVFASRQKVDLVSHDYYDDEVRYQNQIDRVNRTQALGSPAEVTYDAMQQLLTITLPAAHARQQASGRVHFYRPSDASLDEEMKLAVNAAGVQQWDAKQLKAGLWKVRVEWTFEGEGFLVDKLIVINPG
jgi:nitrogen fixation protein FixH